MVEVSMSRKEREEEERKRYILDTAEGLFAQNGHHRTSVADIAKAAEFGIGTLYKHFNDKENLFQALMDGRMLRFHDMQVKALTASDDPLVNLQAYMDGFLGFVAENKNFFHLFLIYINHAIRNGDSSLLDVTEYQAQADHIFALLNDNAQKGIDQGVFMKVDAMYLVSALYGILISSFHLGMYKFGGEWDVDEMRTAMKKLLFEQVLLDGSDSLK